MRRFFFIACALLALGLPAAARADDAAGFSQAQRAEIVAIVRDALRTDPTILRDAVVALRAAEDHDQAEAAHGAIGSEHAALFDNPADPTLGAAHPDVSLVLFYDTRCPYCRRMEPTLAQLLREDPKLRLVIKDIPILGPASLLESRALLAAQKQGGYFKLRDALMAARPDADEALVRSEAKRVGLDWTKLSADMKDPAIEARLQQNIALARKLGVQGTPAMVIGDQMIDGAQDLAELKAAVAKARGG
jgi:protein-disulfide isomerase